MIEANKPISLVRDELVKDIISAINKSNLSYFLLDYILKDVWTEVHNAATQRAQAEKDEWQKHMAAQSVQANDKPDTSLT